MRIEPGFDLDVTREERATVMADMTTLALQQARPEMIEQPDEDRRA